MTLFTAIIPTCESAIWLVETFVNKSQFLLIISCSNLIITYEWYNLVNYQGIYPYPFLLKFSANLFMQAYFYYIIMQAECSTCHHHGETCNVSIDRIIHSLVHKTLTFGNQHSLTSLFNIANTFSTIPTDSVLWHILQCEYIKLCSIHQLNNCRCLLPIYCLE